MINVLLIGFNILLYTLQTLLFKMYGDRYPGNPKYTSFVYSVFCGIVSAVISLCFGGFGLEFNPVTLIFGILNALTLPMYYLTINAASQNGPYSIVMLFSIAGGITIPVFISAIAFGEYPSVWKLLCFACIFAAGYFVTKKPSEDSIKNKKKFFLFASALAVVNGLYGGFINLQKGITGEGQNDEMLIYTFVGGALFSLLILFATNKGGTGRLFLQTKGSLAFMIAAAICASLAINMLVVISKYVDVNLLWTYNNSGVLVLSVIASAIFFKEKITLMNAIGCAVIAVMLVLVNFC